APRSCTASRRTSAPWISSSRQMTSGKSRRRPRRSRCMGPDTPRICRKESVAEEMSDGDQAQRVTASGSPPAVLLGALIACSLLPLELHGPERFPRLACALALLHPVATLTGASPGRTQLHSPLIRYMLGGKDNRVGTVLDRPDQDLALAVPVPEPQSPLLGVPTVQRLPRIRGITVPHDMSVADELSVEYPLEAVLVRRLAVGKGAHPTVPHQELQWSEIRNFGLGSGEQRERREGREGI